MTTNRAELQALLGRALYDVAAAHSAAAIALGDRLGLYRALAEAPATSAELASRTGTDERYVREWLLNQAASGYVTRQGAAYSMTAAQAEVLANRGGVDVAAAMELALAVAISLDPLEQAFRTGDGIAFADYDPRTAAALDRFSAAAHRAHLLEWIPRDIAEKFDAGARAIDLGCGGGSALSVLAARFPRSHFTGVDAHGPSIAAARDTAPANVTFEAIDASQTQGTYDLVLTLDVLHDLADPSSLASHVATLVAPGGSWLIVEPHLVDDDAELLNPYGRFLTALSMTHCIPVSRAAGGPAHGMTMRHAALLDLVRDAGFTTKSVDAQTATVIDARRP